MAAGTSRKRTSRLAVILPPLLFLMLFGYWQFVGSSAMRVVVEIILGRSLGATVTIGGHRITRPSVIELSDLEMAFLAEGKPSGVRFRTRRATARAMRLVGLGPFEEVVIEDPEARFRRAGPSLTRLELLQRKGDRPGVARVEFRNMALIFELQSSEEQGNTYRVGGIDLVLDFSGGGLGIAADLGELRIEGLQSPRLEREKPEIAFDIEIAKSKVALRQLSVAGRTGWKAEGDVEADLAGAVPRIKGELQIRDLKVSTIYTSPPQISVRTATGESASVRRTVRFDGAADDFHYSATTDVPEFIYEDTKLGLKAEGTTLKGLKAERRTSLSRLLGDLFDRDETDEAEPPDAAE